MTSIQTLRIIEPSPGIFAYYDGRIEGKRLHSEAANWLDDGAYALGIASYAIVNGSDALVYDTHISLDHARAIRKHLESLGATSIRVVLSHHHDDHVAGNAVFADCDIFALRLTRDAMERKRQEMEVADPPICPVVMPTHVFDGQMELFVGSRRIELHHFDIHSHDGLVLWLPDVSVLLAGDTLEDTITYVSEAENIATHLAELDRMATWPIERILPNHGSFEQIQAGGYDKGLIAANSNYLARLTSGIGRGDPVEPSLFEFIRPDLDETPITYFLPYENVHRDNISAVRAALGTMNASV